MKRFWGFALVAAAGCGSQTVPMNSSPAREGMFLVSGQEQQQPVVEIKNETPVVLHLLLNKADGKTITLDVSPDTTGRVEVSTGHYEAKVFDSSGRVKSAFGTADITEYRKYEADFIVKQGGSYNFHIGS